MNKELKFEPFNLEKALAHPDRVYCKDGKRPTVWYFLDNPESTMPIVAVVDGEWETFSRSGMYDGYNNSGDDLVLLKKTKTVWHCVYRTNSGTIWTSGLYTSKSNCSLFDDVEIIAEYLTEIPDDN